ncbi:hypothetical protein NE237_020789 [Protea cynaroides]|uniref:Uncharacterized protein n=1 Tax=Protea cynaroides TaxID=273540 RepID=A0A9Q0HBW3_9MAGN|nr:hypothetical protein NE237_020789 [Protea cynaroides]
MSMTRVVAWKEFRHIEADLAVQKSCVPWVIPFHVSTSSFSPIALAMCRSVGKNAFQTSFIWLKDVNRGPPPLPFIFQPRCLTIVCARVVNNLMRNAGFLLKQGWPLFVSEFGGDQRGTNVNDSRYLDCFFGSYYLREGVVDMDETYGILDWGPGVSNLKTYKIILHTSTGLCVHRNPVTKSLSLGSCAESEAWDYTPEKILMVKGTYDCLQADGVGKPAKLGFLCTDTNSKWEPISDSKMHFSTKLSNGRTVCLDVDSNNAFLTNPCKCLSEDHLCDPGSQWFKIVNSTRIRSSTTARLCLPSEKDQVQLEISNGAQIEEGRSS